MRNKEQEKRKKELDRLAKEAEQCGALQYDSEDEEHCRLLSVYKINAPEGKLVYEGLSDEELCDYLRKRAFELGHVPSQREVYWVYQIYIKKRFGNWPKALKKAVLSTKAGKGGSSYEEVEKREQLCKELLDRVKKKGEELHRPPHMAEMRDCIEGLKIKYDTWNQVLAAAGINRDWKNRHMLFLADNLSEHEGLLLERIKCTAVALGRPPLRTEIDADIIKGLKEKCGTWRNILYQIGMEPVEKRKSFTDTYLDERKNKGKRHSELLSSGLYKMISPDEGQKEMVSDLGQIVENLGRAPIKEELPSELYKELMSACGSYRNVLYQVGAEPLDKSENQRVKRRLRKKKEIDNSVNIGLTTKEKNDNL